MNYVIEEKTQEYWERKDIKARVVIFLQVLAGLPKTILFNLHYFGWGGLHFPVLLSPKVKLSKLKGKVLIEGKKSFGGIKLGFPATETYNNHKLSFVWVNDGIVVFTKKASIHNGASIRNYGVLEFGENFHVPATAVFICYKHVKFGDNALIGWDFEVSDGDAHKICKLESPEIRVNQDKEVIIGNNVWIGSDVRIYKGVTVANSTVIAAGTRLYKNEVKTEHCIIGGNPVHVLKENVLWRI